MAGFSHHPNATAIQMSRMYSRSILVCFVVSHSILAGYYGVNLARVSPRIFVREITQKKDFVNSVTSRTTIPQEPRSGRSSHGKVLFERFFLKNHASQQRKFSLQRLNNTALRCKTTVRHCTAFASQFYCSLPAALSIANAALTQSFFGTAAAQRKQRSCNL